MSLIKWSPFFEPFENFDKMLELSGNSGRVQSLVPAIDVYDVKDLVVIETVLPGVDPKNVTLSVEKGMLIISGTSERKTEVDDKDYYRKEIRSGSFMRQVALPAGTSEVNAKASFKDGILKIEFPKTQIDRPKTIKIEVTSE